MDKQNELRGHIKRNADFLNDKQIIEIVRKLYTNSKYKVKVVDNPLYEVEAGDKGLHEHVIINKVYEDSVVRVMVKKVVKGYVLMDDSHTRRYLYIIHKTYNKGIESCINKCLGQNDNPGYCVIDFSYGMKRREIVYAFRDRSILVVKRFKDTQKVVMFKHDIDSIKEYYKYIVVNSVTFKLSPYSLQDVAEQIMNTRYAKFHK